MVRCKRCGEVVGVYEPMIVVADGDAHRTSLAASGRAAVEAAECYYAACYLDPADTAQARA